MRLTILGKWSPYPPVGGACPGYLVEAGGVRLLLDCGSGVVARLQQFVSPFDLDAAVITHLHPDHFTDIYPLQSARRFGRYPQPPAPPLPLFAPANTPELLTGCFPKPSSRSEFREQFAFHPLEDGTGRAGGLTFRFVRTSHPMPCHAVEIAADGRRLVYTADTGPSAAVEALATGCDLFLCESTLAPQDEGLAVELGHLSGRLAGEMAARAGVRRLLLTHFSTARDAVQESFSDAAKGFGGDVAVAEEGLTYEV